MAGRPPGSPNKDKPLKDAIRMEAAALANGEVIQHPKGSWRALAQALLFKGSDGDVPAIKEAGDRVDGKVAQPLAGDDELPPIGIEAIERVIVDPKITDTNG